MTRLYANSHDIMVGRITACLVLCVHALFMYLDPGGELMQEVPHYDELMAFSRYVVWFPSILVALAMTFMNEKVRSLIPVATAIAVMLHGLGFVAWALILGEKGPGYLSVPILMVTIMVNFTGRIPFRYSLGITLIYTSAFIAVSLKHWMDVMGDFGSMSNNREAQEIAMVIISTIGSTILISFCSYRTESVIIRLEESRAFIRASKSSRYRWLENMASFLRHEIENKHIAVSQSIKLLNSGENHNPQVTKYSERALRSLFEMKYLIDQTVKATDIETALMSSNDEPLRFDHLVRWYVASKTSGENNLTISFTNKVRTGQLLVYGDKLRLEQMIEKIVSNAIDFSNEGSEIRLVLRQLDQAYCLEVENDGPLLPDNCEHIFDFNYTSRDYVEADAKNTGFGLYIAHRIAEHHSGSLSAYNREDGSGPTIAVSLPEYSQRMFAG